MQVCYISVWKLHGATKIASGAASLALGELADPNIVASIVTDLGPYFLHIDQSAAIGAQLLKGYFGQDKEGTFEERLASEIADIKARRAEQTGTSVFLVIEGETVIATPEFKHRRDTDEFGVCIDAIEKPEIRQRFRPVVEAVLTAVGLSLPAGADRRVERMGDVIYLVDPDNRKPIYTASAEFGLARLSGASPVTDEVAADAAKLAPKIVGEPAMAKPIGLLITSLDHASDGLQAFIAAWSALEIIVNATFKERYQARWFDIMEAGAPVSAKPVFERFKEVMSDKYRLADKFLIIASVLDADAAATDWAEFRRLKGVRDDLLHGRDTPQHLPTEAGQTLLLKYMKLHLDLLD